MFKWFAQEPHDGARPIANAPMRGDRVRAQNNFRVARAACARVCDDENVINFFFYSMLVNSVNQK